MTYTDKRIIASYSGLFEGLSTANKVELIESLSKSLKVEKETKEAAFYKSFASNQSAEEIIKEIKTSRKFRKKEISL